VKEKRRLNVSMAWEGKYVKQRAMRGHLMSLEQGFGIDCTI